MLIITLHKIYLQKSLSNRSSTISKDVILNVALYLIQMYNIFCTISYFQMGSDVNL